MSKKSDRLYDYIDIDLKTVQKLFSKFDNNISVDKFELIPEGLSTSNYSVYTNNLKTKYLLKLYPENGGNSEIEVSSYKYSKKYVNVPKIYLYDNSKTIYNRAYVIMEFIDGITLKEYVVKNKEFPSELVYNIASSLALLHNRKYNKRGFLNNELNIKSVLPSIKTQFVDVLNSYAGNHLDIEIKNDIQHFINENNYILDKLDSTYVYSHGDFYPSNIMVDKNNSIWFIDFEYSLSTSMYLDIGKFFRDRTSINKYITKDVYNHFFKGYNASSDDPLESDWIKIAILIDMLSMLGLINNENPSNEWVKAIEQSIVDTLKYLSEKDV